MVVLSRNFDFPWWRKSALNLTCFGAKWPSCQYFPLITVVWNSEHSPSRSTRDGLKNHKRNHKNVIETVWALHSLWVVTVTNYTSAVESLMMLAVDVTTELDMNCEWRDLSMSSAASGCSSARSDSARSSPALTSAVTHSLQQSTGLEQREPPLIEMFHTSVWRTTSESGDSIHQLRLSTQYRYDEQYVPWPTKLLKAFNTTYVPFRDGKPIPKEARQRLEEFELSSEEFYGLVTELELPKSRYIYLDQGKIKYVEWT